MDKKNVVGIFDSGVGGFSVLHKIQDVMEIPIIYFGDCANAPYGNKTNDEIITYIKNDIAFLQKKSVTHFVNACNSMSVITTEAILQEMNIKEEMYTDMIRAFKKYTTFSKGDNVLVVATEATIRSGAYQEVLLQKEVDVCTYISKTLAYDIENDTKEEALLESIIPILIHAKENKVTHILYGCTHYPLVHDIFVHAKDTISWVGDLVDPALYVAKEISSWNLLGEKEVVCYSSKDTEVFKRYASSVIV